MTPTRDRWGYLSIRTWKDGKRLHMSLHRLVLSSFDRLPKEGEVVRHLNGVCDDNRIENLAWGTAKENAADKFLHNRVTRMAGEKNGSAKLTQSDVFAIRAEPQYPGMQLVLAERFGVSRRTIRDILDGKKWAHLLPSVAEGPTGARTLCVGVMP